MVIKNEILFHTFIGQQIEVINSTQKEQIGLKGEVVDETKNMLSIISNGREIKLQKVAVKIRFFVDDGFLDVDCSKIAFRPHERPKKI